MWFTGQKQCSIKILDNIQFGRVLAIIKVFKSLYWEESIIQEEAKDAV